MILLSKTQYAAVILRLSELLLQTCYQFFNVFTCVRIPNFSNINIFLIYSFCIERESGSLSAADEFRQNGGSYADDGGSSSKISVSG